MSLYAPGDTWVHRLDPITKLLMAGVGIVLTFLLPSLQGGAALLAVLLLVLGTAGVLHRAVPVYVGVAVIGVTFVVVQGLVNPANVHPLARLGPVVLYREGLLVGLRLALRLYDILSATLILVLVTNPSDLVESLVRRGASPRFGYVMMAVLQIIPTMVASTATITDAQRSRGMETEGRLWVRLRAFVPLMGPLVTGSLIATEERALALEVRGFAGNRRPTFLKEERMPGYAAAVRLLSLAVLLLGVAGRWLLGW
ncbi:energy-coupling factor transporter transmembrane component T family protein [Limnochorda pilosa]|uniref:energy-coupling factor transporter transmembrane component T family protein n=1 Tax=Limnochorda pilosa TaxID=1555112 RepID=UPI0018E0B7A8|nr:energy-coupling factor transporter transmembrane component T [Limnochorda pilosa]